MRRNDKIAHTAALLALTLGSDARFAAWYNSDDWGGMVGLTEYVANLAAQLEDLTGGEMCLGEGVDWYITADNVVDAILQGRQLTRADLSGLLFHWDTNGIAGDT